MRKNKILKKGMILGLAFSLLAGMVPMNNLTATTAPDSESSGEISEGAETSSSNQMLHFVMDVRWGNVNGEPTNSKEANFDGSVSVSNKARVSLERTLLFEKHNSTADKITKRKNPVSWNSLTYGHWDGVKVLISSPANDSVIITTTQGSVTMSAQDLYDLSELRAVDVGEDREIVIETYPIKTPRYFLKVVWGKTDRAEYGLKGEADEIESNAVMVGRTLKEVVKNRLGKSINLYDASGHFEIDGGGTLRFIKSLRFEGTDRITENSAGKIEWVSHVAQGVDGILTELNLDANSLVDSDTVTLSFAEVAGDDETSDWSESFKIMDLYHNRVTKVSIKGEYNAVLQVWRKTNREIIRVRNNPTVYVVEDGVKRPIPSPAVLHSQGLSFGNISEVDQNEADTYADGNAICYADGTLVREKNRSEVYVIADGEKKHIENPQAFEDLFGEDRWNKIVEVNAGVLGLYRNRAALKSNSTYPEGSLIREAGKQTVYLVEGGKKKPITSDKIFRARGLDWDKVVEINRERMEVIATANETLRYPDGALLKDLAGKVYRMDQGKKRWIRSGDDLTGAGYKAENIIEVTDVTEINDLTAIEDGSDVFADDVN